MADQPKPFDRATLEAAFERMGELARNAEKTIEISIYGGSAQKSSGGNRLGSMMA